MRVQEYVADMTERAVDNYYQNIKRVPEERWEWRVLDAGRSVLDQAQEVAVSPLWSISLIREKKAPPFDPERMARMKVEMSQCTTLEKCEEVHRANLHQLLSAIRDLQDGELTETVTVPFADQPVPLGSVIMFHYWNVVYHQGQILFIQTLYGDQEMTF